MNPLVHDYCDVPNDFNASRYLQNTQKNSANFMSSDVDEMEKNPEFLMSVMASVKEALPSEYVPEYTELAAICGAVSRNDYRELVSICDAVSRNDCERSAKKPLIKMYGERRQRVIFLKMVVENLVKNQFPYFYVSNPFLI